jgi:probable HAF family extracellular repeat protein
MFKDMKRMGRCTVIATVVGLFCSTEAPAKKPPADDEAAQYTVVDLLGIPGNSFFQSQAGSLSEPDEAGGVLVVGNSHNQGALTPAFWSVCGEGTFPIGDVNLGLPPGATGAEASDINDLGVITVNTEGTTERDEDGHLVLPAWVLVPGRALQELPRWSSRAKAHALNNLGEIVGKDGGDGALWRLDAAGTPGAPISLGSFFPSDINDQGLMVGRWYERPGGQAAIAWFDDAGNLHVEWLGLQTTWGSEATAISDNGAWVAGYFEEYVDDAWYFEAFVWTAETGMVGLGTLERRDLGSSVATGVNNRGQVVGLSSTGRKNPQAAFLWQNGQMVDLNSLIDPGDVYLSGADDINEAGHVVGFMGIPSVSQMHGFLLVPNAE